MVHRDSDRSSEDTLRSTNYDVKFEGGYIHNNKFFFSNIDIKIHILFISVWIKTLTLIFL